MRTVSLVGLVVLVGCSIPDKHPGTVGPTDGASGGSSDGAGTHDGAVAAPDGPAGPFGCQGHALPTTAPPTITLSGTVSDFAALTTSLIAGAEVDMAVGSQQVFSKMTDGSGAFTASVATGGMPVDGIITASATTTSYVDTFEFPSQPYATDQVIPILMVKQADLASVGSLTGVSVNSTLGQVVIFVVDCNGAPVSGAKIAAQSGTIRYFASQLPSSSATSTDSSGEALVFNADTGLFKVQATAPDGSAMRTHDVLTAQGVLTQAYIQP